MRSKAALAIGLAALSVGVAYAAAPTHHRGSASISPPDTAATPLPPGSNVVGRLAYAEDRLVSAEAARMLREVTGKATATVVAENGDRVTVQPRLLIDSGPLVPTGHGYWIVLTGNHGECHACSGVATMARITREADGSFDGSVESAKPLEWGSWGQVAELTLYLQPGNGLPLVRASYQYGNSGCFETTGQLFRLNALGFSPLAAPYHHDDGCAGK